MINIDILLLIGGHGGFENALRNTADYLADHDCNVRFIQLIPTDIKWYSSKTSFFCLDLSRKYSYDETKLAYAKLLSKNGAPDIIIAAGSPDLIYTAKGATQDLGLEIPVILWPHSEIGSYDTGTISIPAILQYAEFAFAISDKIAEEIHALCPSMIIYRVNNTYDKSKIHFKDQRDTLKLAFVGRLAKEKNVSLIIKALSLTKKPWELNLIGTGEEEQSLKELSDSLGLNSRIHFLGWQEDPYKEADTCRALVISSVSSIEGAPLTCIEALVCGMQVISTPIPFVQEVITEGVTGFIYDFDDPQALANTLDRLAESSFDPSTSKTCSESVLDFTPEIALWDFLCKVRSSKELKALPQRNWQDKNTRIIHP